MTTPIADTRVTGACVLAAAAGSPEPCRPGACAYWEAGSAVLDGGCMLERFLPGSDWTPDLAAAWLRLRSELERTADERRRT